MTSTVSPESDEIRITNPTTGGQKGAKAARHSLIPIGPLTDLAVHFGLGADKYSDHNWRLGTEWSLNYDALTRHLLAFWNGEDVDPETGSPHLSAVAWHAMVLRQFQTTHPDLDDRPSTLQREQRGDWTPRALSLVPPTPDAAAEPPRPDPHAERWESYQQWMPPARPADTDEHHTGLLHRLAALTAGLLPSDIAAPVAVALADSYTCGLTEAVDVLSRLDAAAKAAIPRRAYEEAARKLAQPHPGFHFEGVGELAERFCLSCDATVPSTDTGVLIAHRLVCPGPPC